MLLSVRSLRACATLRSSSLPVASVSLQIQKSSQRSFLTDGANVIGSNPERNSPDFKVTQFISGHLNIQNVISETKFWFHLSFSLATWRGHGAPRFQ